MAQLFQNGPTPFLHPVSNLMIGPFEFYEGYAHIESENAQSSEEEVKPERKRTNKKQDDTE